MKAEYIDHMGSDLSVVNDARVSFAKESEWVETCGCGIVRDRTASNNQWPGCGADERQCSSQTTKTLAERDAKLIRYLATHNHWTPFAHTSIKIRMTAPVPIRTQCFKHKAGFVENEESRRYIDSRPELFEPEVFREKPEGSIKQGSGGEHPRNSFWKAIYKVRCEAAISDYMRMIQDGVCPEQARFVLPQGVEVNWRWTGSLAAYARFYKQRTDPHAQKETQELAEAVSEIIAPLFPVSWKALTE